MDIGGFVVVIKWPGKSRKGNKKSNGSLATLIPNVYMFVGLNLHAAEARGAAWTAETITIYTDNVQH